MTLTADEFREQLLDYVYGELDGEQRARFEASLAASAAYQQELATLQGTLQLARQGLAALDADPPLRVNKTVLAFAEQELAKAKAPRREERVSKSGFLTWLRNPTFVAALGVATIMVLTVLNKKSVFAPSSNFPAGTPSSAPRPAEERPVPAAPITPASPEAHESGAEPSRERAPREVETRATPRTQLKRQERPAPNKHEEQAPTTGVRSDERAARRFAEPPAKSSASSEAEFAPAPPPAAAAVPMSAPAATSGSIGSLRDRAAQDNTAQDLRGAAAPAARERARSGPLALPGAVLGRTAQTAPAELVLLAHEHVTHTRWSEAVHAYRQLLDRYPSDARAAQWREQLSAATRKLREQRPAGN